MQLQVRNGQEKGQKGRKVRQPLSEQVPSNPTPSRLTRASTPFWLAGWLADWFIGIGCDVRHVPLSRFHQPAALEPCFLSQLILKKGLRFVQGPKSRRRFDFSPTDILPKPTSLPPNQSFHTLQSFRLKENRKENCSSGGGGHRSGGVNGTLPFFNILSGTSNITTSTEKKEGKKVPINTTHTANSSNLFNSHPPRPFLPPTSS
ncbi:hypothetical protein TWF506_009022 [Arthrobotrys conoides]|uniref:Uncharacterized protein n=1 Tax=Arthrobotrys conoides TaxID=74498 RepID=A0AAN8NBL0_9PEZI